MRVVWCAIAVLVTAVAIRAEPVHPDLKIHTRTIRHNVAEKTPDFWRNEAKEAIERRLNHKQNTKQARNIIMFLGDGLSVPTLAPARILKGQRENRTGEETSMYFEGFPTVGLSKVSRFFL